MPITAAEQEQQKWLDDAKGRVEVYGYNMNRATDTSSVPEAIRHAANLIGELRTSKLSPQNYYDLYMDVTNELRSLGSFFEHAEASKGTFSVVQMYEEVQHTDKIIPRLYLLITVAGVYIKSMRATAKDILFDLVELCRGVQHPMRGLFLRNYLSQMSRNKLPDQGSQYEGNVEDSIEFILQNFGEMNKLWVRMQHQGAFRTMLRREMERKNLRQLVGTNLVRLSEMRGVDINLYKTLVLPRILEQVVNCKDVIAQEYLMDCIIQVFPDDFHLATLETFLTTCSQLQDNVNVKDIIIRLMDRLATYARDSPDSIPDDIEMFPLFHKYSAQVIESKPDMKLADILSLQVALVNFASGCYSDRLAYLDHIHAFSVQAISKCTTGTVEDTASVQHIISLLSLPLNSISLRILELQNYARLLQTLALPQRKQVAVAITKAAKQSPTTISTVEEADALFKYLSPLIVEDVKVSDDDRFEFEQEQHGVAQLFQLIRSNDTDIHFEMYGVARRYFGRGGTHRLEFTLPPLVMNSLELAQRAFDNSEGKKAKQIFGFIHETIGALKAAYPELSLRLFMQAAQASSRCHFEAISYEFVAQAFITYEDDITGSRDRYATIVYMAGALQQMTGFSEENYDTLIKKALQHSAKLMIKVNQCRAVYTCAHLFWAGSDESPVHRDGKKVLACLKRSLKIANTCMGQQVPMFVEILNKYLYFYHRKCPTITAEYLGNFINLIDEHIVEGTSPEARRHYENTLAHIHQKQLGEGGERYAAIFPKAQADTTAAPTAATTDTDPDTVQA